MALRTAVVERGCPGPGLRMLSVEVEGDGFHCVCAELCMVFVKVNFFGVVVCAAV